MLRDRLGTYRDRARRMLTQAFRTDHTPRQVAASFSIGVFVTTLPTGGIGVGLFFVFVSLWPWISKPAIFASVAVLNPFVKPVVYVASYQVGGTVLGTVPLLSSDISSETARTAVRQLIVGNLLVAVALAGIGYLLLLRLTLAHRRRRGARSDPSDSSA
ncbi:hypothetical protein CHINAEXTREME_19310 [Halobiforma lacisalsi AJ5]|uniref:DUF2062 domain-containing protein n=1 Tax=Natronobacterium lacisalsi AJ5 TaxID=358396 RepID=M0LRD6_NATLA|nr:DUF2062 domain-containing protein [Halobiforma lacisalsi]APW99786.1 hypothetical protein CHINAEXTREME_19310 [Halobiforma lacisalsi AJ5]EMA36036.1 hypothetical protein C445_04243 [Halobiforma lacisalsi AJ5]